MSNATLVLREKSKKACKKRKVSDGYFGSDAGGSIKMFNFAF